MFWCCCGPVYTTRCATFHRCTTQTYPDTLYLTTGLGTLALVWNTLSNRWGGSRVVTGVANTIGDFTVINPANCSGGSLGTRDVTLTYQVACPGDITSVFFALTIQASVAKDGGGTWRYLGDGWPNCAQDFVENDPTAAGPGCITPLSWSGTLASTATNFPRLPAASLPALDSGTFALSE